MRIGIVVYGPLDGRSGGYLYDRKLVDGLVRAGHTVVVFSIPESGYGRSIADNWRRDLLDRISTAAVDVLLEDELCHPSLWWVNRRLDRTLPIVSIVHHLKSAEPHSARSIDWLGRTVTAGTLGGRFLQGAISVLERLYLQSVDAFVFNSEATKRTVESVVPSKPNVVAYPAGDRFDVDVSESEAKIHSRMSETPLRIIGVGTVTPRKGFDALIAGLARIEEPWELTIVGDTSVAPGYVKALGSLAEQFGVADRLTVTGRLDEEALASRLAHSHLFAMPSRYEGYGIAYVEGMGFGLPAIASTAGGAIEIVTHGTNGYLVPPADPTAVADAIEPLCRNRQLLASVSRGALDTYRRHPTWQASVDAIEDFLCEVHHESN
ncbi:MAG: glycosyltransferase family 4 protein [Halobacteriota archaeon]